MEIATIITSPSTGLSGILLSSEPNIPEGPEYEKISTLYQVVFYFQTERISISLVYGFLKGTAELKVLLSESECKPLLNHHTNFE